MKAEAINYEVLLTSSKSGFNRSINAAGKRQKGKAIEFLAYWIGLETGLRVSDLLELKYSYFKFSDDINRYVFETPIQKTKNELAGVISDDLHNAIERYKREMKRLHGVTSNKIFFNYSFNKPYTRQWLHKQFKIRGGKLDFENFTVHSIRKAAAIHVYDKGGLSLAQHFLAHKKGSTTDKYLGVTKKTVLEQLSRII